VLASPFQHRRIDVDADRLVLIALPHPLARCAGRAAEIFAEKVGRPTCEGFERRLQKLDFVFHILNRQFIQLVDIGPFSHRPVLGVFHGLCAHGRDSFLLLFDGVGPSIVLA
jgi:hypothetical protein